MSDLLATQRDNRYTENNEAYQLYLKGRFLWNKRTWASLKQAVEFYNQAIEKDPAFALAFAVLQFPCLRNLCVLCGSAVKSFYGQIYRRGPRSYAEKIFKLGQ
jgi:hypothetical protein